MAAAIINVAPEGNLSRYLQEIRKFPMLLPEEELALSRAGVTARTPRPRTSSSPRTCASSPRSPWATAATACRWAS